MPTIARREKAKAKKDIKLKISKLRPKPKSGSYRDAWKLRYKNYDQYLASKEWKAIKEVYYSYDCNKKCEACGSQSKLHVHHHSYAAIGSINEIDHLRTLCSKCHKKVHDLEKSSELTLKQATAKIISYSKSNKKRNKSPKVIDITKSAQWKREQRFLNKFKN